MKKIIISVLVTLLVACPTTYFVTKTLSNKNNSKDVEVKEEVKNLTKGVKKEEKLAKYDLPKNINILIRGLYDEHLGEEELSKLDVYSIEAVIETDTGLVEKTYVGIKIKDVEEMLQLKGHQAISLKADQVIRKNIAAEEIDDHYYFMFEEDGIKYDVNRKVKVVDLDGLETYNISGITELYYYNV